MKENYKGQINRALPLNGITARFAISFVADADCVLVLLFLSRVVGAAAAILAAAVCVGVVGAYAAVS
jgi:hypothetical protein